MPGHADGHNGQKFACMYYNVLHDIKAIGQSIIMLSIYDDNYLLC